MPCFMKVRVHTPTRERVLSVHAVDQELFNRSSVQKAGRFYKSCFESETTDEELASDNLLQEFIKGYSNSFYKLKEVFHV